MRCNSSLYGFLCSILLCAMVPPTASAQLDRIFENAIREGINQIRNDREQPPPDPPASRSALPGESGRESGGGRFIDPGWGGETRPPYNPPRNPPVYREAPALRETFSNLPISIRLPKSESGSCAYSLLSPRQSYDFTLQPGFRQKLTENTRWRIRYETGEGTQTYLLRGGNDYVLRKDARGLWQLYRVPPDVPDEPPILPQ